MAGLFAFLKSWRAVAIGLAVTAGVLVVGLGVRPLQVPSEINVPATWIASIQRLGLTPVYPPREDYQVGDLVAVVVDQDVGRVPAKSVRIAHVDMRALILEEQQERVRFAPTPPLAAGESFRDLSAWSEGDASDHAGRIALTLAAFPGLTVRGSRKVSAATGAGGFTLDGSRDDLVEEELHIPVAETYGVSPHRALKRLEDWCKSEGAPQDGNPGRCTADYARAMLMFSFGGHALDGRPFAPPPSIELVVVTQVFLMREVKQRSGRGSDRSATLGAPAAGGAEKPTNAGLETTMKEGIDLSQVFQRPLVFAYRGLSIDF